MVSAQPVRVGLIGCGTISDIYLTNATQRYTGYDIVAVADLMRDRAEAKATQYGIPRALAPEELIADPEIEIVLNLTIPEAHYELNRAAIEAGKAVYCEKPLAVDPDEARHLVELAAERGVLLGGAPDTFLGAGLQTCRRLLDAGEIGEPVGVAACFASHGNEHWHPNPDFSYRHGGGPQFNLGPYYLTALVSLLGPVRRLAGNGRISFPTRTISSQPRAGETITVETPTFLNAVLEFESGPVGSFTATYDVWATERPKIEIYGSEGTLSVPDPNRFDGPVRLYRHATKAWEEVPLDPGFSDNSRGLGLADFANALRSGDQPRAGGQLMSHVVELMQAMETSAEAGAFVTLVSTMERPSPLDVASIGVSREQK
jgi:predicted dehydrogenase